MFKLGSILLMFLLTVPIVRDCCLPVVHTPQCHESKRTADITCSANDQAIAETKAAIGSNSTLNCAVRVNEDVRSAVLNQIRSAPDGVTPTTIPTPDLYLRTGALLI
jgi:hypothetical protein